MGKTVTTPICIENASGIQEGHRYILYSSAPEMTSDPGGYSTFQSALYLTTTRTHGQQDTTEITSELYAVICDCKGYRSEEMQYGRHLVLRDKKLVTLGNKSGEGTSLEVKADSDGITFDETSTTNSTPWGTFKIRCNSKLPQKNSYAVGLGRKVGDTIVPVSVVRCFPSAKFTFKPVDTFHVAHRPPPVRPRGHVGDPLDFKIGTIMSPNNASSPQQPAEAVIDDTGNTIRIIERPGGTFHVSGTPLNTFNGDFPDPLEKEHLSKPAASQSPSSGAKRPTVSADDILTPEELTNLFVKRFPDYRPQPTCTPDGNNDEEILDESLSLDRLKQWDIVFVVDDTGTMQLPTRGDHHKLQRNYRGLTRWGLTCKALEYLADAAASRDKNGVDLYFLVNRSLNKRNATTGQEILDQLKKNVIRDNGGGTFFEPVLHPILAKYMKKLDKAMADDVDLPPPLDIIVLTDGAAHDKSRTEKMLVKTANRLETNGISESQLGIQFVQVGEDKKANEWLRSLYAKVNVQTKHEIIDVQTYSDLDDQTNQTFGQKLLKILLGAMEPREDNSLNQKSNASPYI
ncbi:hypothetical protein F4779DRAFT_618444 [Xylariaceae sp. FL0662B]|nr:hypothetical protein F4779DRAFT_618444 [Xylariaceae sp. FL0662B]